MHRLRALARAGGVLFASVALSACIAPGTPSAAPSTIAALPSLAPSPSIAAPSAALTTRPSVVPSEAPSPEPSADPTPEPSEELDGTAGPGCGTGRAGLFAHNDEVPDTLRFGGATIEFVNISVSMRNGTYDASDSVPGGIGLTPDEIAVVVGPGDRIVLRAAGQTLTAAQARVVPWQQVEFDGLASLRGEPTDLSWRLRADGSISIAAPTEAGDYALEVFPSWTGTCISGGGVAYSRIKVR